MISIEVDNGKTYEFDDCNDCTIGKNGHLIITRDGFLEGVFSRAHFVSMVRDARYEIAEYTSLYEYIKKNYDITHDKNDFVLCSDFTYGYQMFCDTEYEKPANKKTIDEKLTFLGIIKKKKRVDKYHTNNPCYIGLRRKNYHPVDGGEWE